MKSRAKSQRKTALQTKEDFLRWLKERQALTMGQAAEQITQADHFTERALMVWVDDGGRPN